MTAAAFFDVDETLIRLKSMFSFLEYYLAERGEPPETFRRLTADLHSSAAAGVPRAEINRRYYRLYLGEPAARLAAVGEEWFRAQLRLGLFIPQAVAALDAHRERGEPVILLSGSFFACLDPIARHAGATHAFGTRPVIRDGLLTGEVLTPMIGRAKAAAAVAAAALFGWDLEDSYAYADHESDLALLELVGHGVVVGDDPVLAGRADASGWQRLDSAAPVAAGGSL